MLVLTLDQGYNNPRSLMRTKTLLLITILAAYGYYLHALSGAAQHHVDALRGQYNAALSSIDQQQVYDTASNQVVQYAQLTNR